MIETEEQQDIRDYANEQGGALATEQGQVKYLCNAPQGNRHGQVSASAVARHTHADAGTAQLLHIAQRPPIDVKALLHGTA